MCPKKGLRKEGNETSSDLPHMLTADTEEYPLPKGALPVPEHRKSLLLAKQHAQSSEARSGTREAQPKKATTSWKDSSGSSHELLQVGKRPVLNAKIRPPTTRSWT